MASAQSELFRPHQSVMLAQAGEALFGENWQSPLARALRVNVRTMQRIAAAAHRREAYPVAPQVLDGVVGLLAARAEQCVEIKGEILDARGV
jgi:hypothetical protein